MSMENDYIHKDEVARLVQMAHMEGRIHEREQWIGSTVDKCMNVRITLRDGNEVEQINTVLSFEDIKQGRHHIMERFVEEAFLGMFKGKILPSLITASPKEELLELETEK